MLKSYFKIIVRSLARNKTFSLINLMGLSIGLASITLIGLYVFEEFSFDHFHEKADQVYQISIVADYDGQVAKWNSVPNAAAPTFTKDIPEIEKGARILANNFTGKAYVSSADLKSYETRFMWADPEIFDILTFKFIKGDPSTALARPHTVVISEASAIKYFGTTDVIGKPLRVDRDTLDFEITGVMENSPSNSRFQFAMVASFIGSHFYKQVSWGNASFETYLLLHKNADPSIVKQKMEAVLQQEIKKDERWFTLELHPLTDIHLQYADVREMSGGAKGDMNQLNILIGLGFIIILIAAVNYTNLSTAQSQRRFKEIGINKTLGATSSQLARKFYLETSLFVLLALVISIQLVIIALPFFNSVTGKNFGHEFLTLPWFWISYAIIWLLLTTLAGFYPALYLSSFQPKEVLKGSHSGLGGNSSLRKVLVIVQFSVSIILIISTLILYQQLQFIRDKKLGYEPEQVVAIGTLGAETRQQINTFKNSLEGMSFVEHVARAQSYPGGLASGRTLPALDGQGSGKSLATIRATPEILDVLGIKLIAGKTLSEKADDDTTAQIVLNKSAVEFLGLKPEEIVNRTIDVQGFYPIEVVGVTEDFHFSSLREPIGAFAFHNAKTEGHTVLLVRLQMQHVDEALPLIEKEFKKNIPSAFEYTFLDQQLDTLYRTEKQLASIILIFSALAIFIACLGLYALAAYTTEQRVKEIGIRKVMGASVFQLSNMLSADFLKLVLISFMIAAPISYYFMHQWLQKFAYRIEIGILIYVAAAFISVLIAWFTVGFESFRAAQSNPVKSLRRE